MIPASQAYIDAIAQTSRSFRARFLDENDNVIEGSLLALSYRTGACSDKPQPGGYFSPYAEAAMDGLAQSIYGQEIRLQIGVITDQLGSIEYVTVGTYWVAQTQTAGTRTVFKAVGSLTWAGGLLYSSELTYPASLSSVISEIASQSGMTIITKGFTVSGTLEKAITGLTYTGALAQIASLLGGFVTEDRQGRVVLAAYGSGDTYAMDMTRVTSRPSYTEQAYVVTGITCIVTGDSEDEEGQIIPGISYTYGTPNVTIVNPYMTQALFNVMAPRYTGLTFYPATVPLTLGNPLLEPWDVLSITDTDGTVRVVPCHLIESLFTGGFSQQITAELSGDTDESDEPVAGPLSNQVAEIGSSLLTARRSAAAAKAAADQAVEDAEAASEAATQAQAQASAASAAAGRAETSASAATEAANGAVKGLAQVEDVVGVLNWINQHGTMTSQAGTTFDENKVYFIVDPSGDYVVGGTHYSLVTNPVATDIDSYYCLFVDESIQNYVATHIAVNTEGLWLIPEDNATPQSSSKKVLIAVGGRGHTYPDAGTYIIDKIDGVDCVLAKFGANGAIVGQENGTHIEIGDSRFTVYYADGSTEAVTISEGLVEVGERSTALYSYEQVLSDCGLESRYRPVVGLTGVPICFIGIDTGREALNKSFNTGTSTVFSLPSSPAVESYIYIYATGAAGGGKKLMYVVRQGEPQTFSFFTGTMYYDGQAEFTYTRGQLIYANRYLRFEFDTERPRPYLRLRESLNSRPPLASIGTGLVVDFDNQVGVGRYNDNKQNNAFEIGNGADDNNRSNAFEVSWDGACALYPKIAGVSGGSSLITGYIPVERDTSPSAAEYYSIMKINDLLGNRLAYMDLIHQTVNNKDAEGFRIFKTRDVNGSTVYNGITLSIDDDGGRRVSVSDPSAWRTAIGLSNLMVTEAKSLGSVEIPASGVRSVSASVAKSGYTPLGIVGITKTGSNNGDAVVSTFNVSGTTATVSLRNQGSATRTPSVTAYILYIKTL